MKCRLLFFSSCSQNFTTFSPQSYVAKDIFLEFPCHGWRETFVVLQQRRVLNRVSERASKRRSEHRNPSFVLCKSLTPNDEGVCITWLLITAQSKQLFKSGKQLSTLWSISIIYENFFLKKVFLWSSAFWISKPLRSNLANIFQIRTISKEK